MIVYFTNRQLNILGQASTGLPCGFTISEDWKVDEIDTGVSVFECVIPFDDDTRALVEACTKSGNYIMRNYDGANEFYTIVEREIDTKNQEVSIYAEDAGLDLLNEIVEAYEADKAYPITHYIEKFAYDSGFEIGVNEASSLTRKLSWDGESTAAERIASVATQFDGCEISFSFDIKGLEITRKYINIFKERGKDIGANLRLNEDIDRIVTKESIMNLATALKCTGGTPEDENTEDDKEPVPITLQGYKYDDGNFYVDGVYLKSREALKKWSRYSWTKEPNQTSAGGHITRPFTYDTLSQAELCTHALTELKKACEMEVNYEVDISKLPENIKIGDRINIIDDAGELYVSARLLKLEVSVSREEHKATLGEFLIKSSGISQKVMELAEQFAKNTQSVARALELSKTARDAAVSAQTQVDEAVKSVEEAHKAIDEVSEVVETARQSAAEAQAAAANAQAVVDTVESQIAGIEASINNAQAAAQNAQIAADTAQTKANEAATAAQNALADAETALGEATSAVTASSAAVANASTAIANANTANINAKAAQATADAAKLDAAEAQKDIDALGESLTTLSQTMSAEYARKTDLTETEAALQTQITQNAAQISSTATRVQTIDETANNAQEQAQVAQNAAAAAQSKADQAATDAQAAQTAADNAAAAANSAQIEADTAKAAAATAQGVADKAEADLAKAKADLATVSSRVDATEEEIVAAQQAVEAAQAVADKAKTDAATAVVQAAAAQSTANTAASNASAAQKVANEASNNATLAQKAAEAAKGDASAAVTTANEAKATATAAQKAANTAKTDAENAQARADQAAAEAAAAQQAADDADAKAAQAAIDLATAQQNLANVTSRVDATEAEVEAAKADVVKAQAAATKAQTEAEAAQATADTAKADAATAQAAANTAKTAADNAQKAATDAQQAADDAQAAVDALAVRVTTAETNITQNAEQIAMTAKKTEVAKMLGGYSTKEETESAIMVESNAITSAVSQTFTTKDDFDKTDSLVQQLANSIATLITDANGTSLMQQTADGWTFSLAQIQETLDSATGSIDNLNNNLDESKAAVDNLQKAIDDLGILANYVRINTTGDSPVLELGTNANNYTVRITNEEIQFADGSIIPTRITRQMMLIERAMVRLELQFGDDTGEGVNGVWIMKRRTSGNLGISWKGVG